VTAQTQGMTVEALGVREPNDFNGAFAAMDREKPDAILMVADALTALNRKRVLDYAVAHRLPSIYESEAFARDLGLMSYGADVRESLARAAYMVDRIFKGTSPGDIPFETPTRYLFVINLKTARAMSLEPSHDLARPRRRCDRVTVTRPDVGSGKLFPRFNCLTWPVAAKAARCTAWASLSVTLSPALAAGRD
jgi:ABC-type uncharacterized transport system substrate-binding protein